MPLKVLPNLALFFLSSIGKNFTRGKTHLVPEVSSDWTETDKTAGNLNANLCAIA